jgi:predicted nucleic acid-binding Zn ribbon protein
MPTYIYRREDGTDFEIEQRISEPTLTVDPETGQKVRRVISGKAGLVFKGSGFYLTDYTNYGKEGKKKPSGDASPETKSGDSKETKSESKPDSKPAETKKSESKPDAPSKPKGDAS